MTERKRPHTGRALIGIAIVIFGLTFLLDNMDMGADIVPRGLGLALIILGAARLIGDKPHSSKLFGSWLILVGFFLMFDLWNLWPLFMIIFGLYILWRAVGKQGVPQVGRRRSSGDSLREFVIFGSSEQIVTSSAFRGGDLTVLFGGVDLDFRDAQMAEGESAVLDQFVCFGGIDLRVPEHWEVVNEAVVIFGSVEDKSRNPREGEQGALSPPRLILRGYVFFGGVEIRN